MPTPPVRRRACSWRACSPQRKTRCWSPLRPAVMCGLEAPMLRRRARGCGARPTCCSRIPTGTQASPTTQAARTAWSFMLAAIGTTTAALRGRNTSARLPVLCRRPIRPRRRHPRRCRRRRRPRRPLRPLRPRNRLQPLTSAAPQAPAGRMVVAATRQHMPSQRQVAGRRPITPDLQPVSMGRGPTSTPRRPEDGRATSSGSPTMAPRALILAWTSAPWSSTTTCTAPPWASSA